MSLIKSIGVAAAALFALAAPAFASTLTIGGGIATVTCTPSCAGIIGGSITSTSQGMATGTLGSLDGSNADLYAISPNNPATEAAALNVLAGTSFTTGVQTDAGGVNSLSFTTTAAWIMLKLGAGTFFLQNTSGAITLMIDYLKASGPAGAGGGFSHYTEFGNAIPIPGAIWLMAAGLAGLGFANRRKKA
jgi:hypothetical protein